MSHQEQLIVTIKFYTTSIISLIYAAIPWFLVFDWFSKGTSLGIAIALFWYARTKYRQDMKNKKLDEDIKRIQLENLQQEQYQLLAKNKLLNTVNEQTKEDDLH
jgi:hypothetical protein